MQATIIQTHDGQLKVGTWDISQLLGIEHRLVKDCIQLYEYVFERNLILKKRKTSRGRPVKEYLLNMQQIKLLIFLLPPLHNAIILIKIMFSTEEYKTEIEFMQNLNFYFSLL